MDISELEIDYKNLTELEKREMNRLLSLASQSPLALQDIWNMMDTVWHEIGCDKKQLDPKKLAEFYSHPVWLLNGFFIEQHSLSMLQRSVIARQVEFNPEIQSVLEYGGGSGTLARLISETRKDIVIDIYEPYPHRLSILKMQEYPNIRFIQSIERQYDCLISTDVLEHVPDPLHLFSQMISHVKVQGNMIIANCFYPVIECHLPETFHLRYTFDLFAAMMGLKVIGVCQKNYGVVYKKMVNKSVNWKAVRTFERLSKISFPLNELALKIRGKVKKVLSEGFAS